MHYSSHKCLQFRAAFAAILLCTLVAAIWNMCLPKMALAYVDPSVMTYTIQSLAGVAVALSAVAGVMFRRTRKTLIRVLGIDENANKEVEGTIHRRENGKLVLEEGEAEEDAALPRPNAKTRAKRREPIDDLPWHKRFVRSLIVIAFCGFTLGISAPFEIVAGAEGDLVYSLTDIIAPMGLFTLVAILFFALLVSLTPKRMFPFVLVLAFSIGLACYVQALVLNFGLPEADGRNIDWDSFTVQNALSAIVWALLIIVPFVLAFKKRTVICAVACMLSVALIIIQGAGVTSLLIKAASNPQSEHIAVTDDGLYSVHPDNNVVVFVLDCYDTKVFEEVLDENPSIVREMDGFTWYRNSAGVMIPTSFAVPYLLTGETPQPGEDMIDYLSRRYTDSDFLEELHETGYGVGIYTDTLGVAYLTDEQEKAEIYENTMNIHDLGAGTFQMSYYDVIVVLTRCALYRDMPWLAKPQFWFYTDEMNWRCVKRPNAMSDETALYSIDDSYFFDSLRFKTLKIDGGGFDGAFRFIHLLGAHEPFSVNAEGKRVSVGSSTQAEQAQGTMVMVGEYLRQMKELGVYEDATIIITSDHGDWVGSLELPQETTEPILLVKRSGEDGDTWDEMRALGEASDEDFAYGLLISDSPVSHEDFHGTVLAAAGFESDEYTTTFDTEFEPDRTRSFFHILHGADAHIRGLVRYEIVGDVCDFDNWSYTGEMYEMDFNNNVR